jgi:hypothetical protein
MFAAVAARTERLNVGNVVRTTLGKRNYMVCGELLLLSTTKAFVSVLETKRREFF